jgi:hypothetical protein
MITFMARVVPVSLIIIVFLSQASKAQDYPAADQKWVSQHSLMHAGRGKGKFSDHEAARLRADYKRMRKMEKRMLLESRTTSRETKKMYLRKEQISREAHSRRTKKNMFNQCIKQA